jgi:hypothetical protein
MLVAYFSYNVDSSFPVTMMAWEGMNIWTAYFLEHNLLR